MTLHERLEGMTIGSALATRATTDPTGVYLVDGGSELTFAEVDAQAEALAASLGSHCPRPPEIGSRQDHLWRLPAIHRAEPEGWQFGSRYPESRMRTPPPSGQERTEYS